MIQPNMGTIPSPPTVRTYEATLWTEANVSDRTWKDICATLCTADLKTMLPLLVSQQFRFARRAEYVRMLLELDDLAQHLPQQQDHDDHDEDDQDQSTTDDDTSTNEVEHDGDGTQSGEDHTGDDGDGDDEDQACPVDGEHVLEINPIG